MNVIDTFLNIVQQRGTFLHCRRYIERLLTGKCGTVPRFRRAASALPDGDILIANDALGRDGDHGIVANQSASLRFHLQFESELRGGAGRNFTTLDLDPRGTGETNPDGVLA